jgi:hypothetical protein
VLKTDHGESPKARSSAPFIFTCQFSKSANASKRKTAQGFQPVKLASLSERPRCCTRRVVLFAHFERFASDQPLREWRAHFSEMKNDLTRQRVILNQVCKTQSALNAKRTAKGETIAKPVFLPGSMSWSGTVVARKN